LATIVSDLLATTTGAAVEVEHLEPRIELRLRFPGRGNHLEHERHAGPRGKPKAVDVPGRLDCAGDLRRRDGTQYLTGEVDA
jgi:hypothetical protein